MRPLIGVTAERNGDPQGERAFKRGYALEYQNELYSALVRRHGALPVLLPLGGDPEEACGLVARLDGLLLSGGSDLDPAHWSEDELEPGGNVEALGEDERLRTNWEHALLEAAFAARLPVFGICRGMQQLNVSLGGSLWQDLERQVGVAGHYETDSPMRRAHDATICARPEGLPAGLPSRFAVTSTHHQAVRDLGRGLVVFARAADDDRVVEGLLRPGGPFLLGVQWHPERMAEDESTDILFKAFVDAASVGGRRGG